MYVSPVELFVLKNRALSRMTRRATFALYYAGQGLPESARKSARKAAHYLALARRYERAEKKLSTGPSCKHAILKPLCVDCYPA